MPIPLLLVSQKMLWMLRALMLSPRRHERGWPRFSLVVTTTDSDQSHRIALRCQGGIDSHDARGPEWEGVQYRPLMRSRHADAQRQS